MAEMVAEKGLLKVDAATLKEWLSEDKCLLVDVRERREYDAARIPGSVLVPLSSFEAAKVPDPAGRHLVVHCQAGMRANDAARRLLKSGVATVWCFEGGMGEWTGAGYATEGAQAPIDGVSCCSGGVPGAGISVQRQTQLAIGLMILLFTLLGQLVDTRLGWLCLLPALGLVNAGATGLCPLATGIAKAPWNR